MEKRNARRSTHGPDGSTGRDDPLRDAIAAFRSDRTKQRFLEALECLSESPVWIPCTAVFGDRDRKLWERRLREAGKHPEALVGKVYTAAEEIRLVPDLLQDGDRLFFPVFSDPAEMGEYGKRVSRVRKPFPEALRMARAGGADLSGIVVNAFSGPFILDRELYQVPGTGTV